MKFTIGTVSNSVNFEEDIRLIKSSLLYADEIELVGMAEYIVLKYLPEKLETINDINSLISTLTPILNSFDSVEAKNCMDQLIMLKDLIEPYKQKFNKKRNRSKNELIAQFNINKATKEFKNNLLEVFSPYIQSQNAVSIQKLVEQGVISIYNYDCKESLIDELSGGFLGNIIRAVQSDTSYPLFDKMCNDFILSYSGDKILDLGTVSNEVLVHAGLATNILMTLPTLESASIDELLDFKKSMNGPLTRFRAAIYDFSTEIKTMPWDPNFKYDCLKLYNTKVAPNIEEINELSSETSTLKNFGRRVLADEEIRRSAAWTIGGITATITSSSNLIGTMDAIKNILISASIVAIAPKAASSFLKALSFYSEAKQETQLIKNNIKSNSMYYYFQASQKLHKS